MGARQGGGLAPWVTQAIVCDGKQATFFIGSKSSGPSRHHNLSTAGHARIVCMWRLEEFARDSREVYCSITMLAQKKRPIPSLHAASTHVGTKYEVVYDGMQDQRSVRAKP